MNKAAVSVVIADDHPVFRSGLSHIIGSNPGFTIVGEAADGTTALTLIEGKKPSVALLDIEMPGMSGLEVVKAVQERQLPTKLIVLTMYTEEDIFNEAMDCGISGYLLKENAVSEVLESIKSVARGGYYISPTISGYLVQRSKRREKAFASVPKLESLTPSEMRILKLIAGNKTSKEIADALCISYKTVENHRANIAEKLELHGNNALLRFALENKTLFL